MAIERHVWEVEGVEAAGRVLKGKGWKEPSLTRSCPYCVFSVRYPQNHIHSSCYPQNGGRTWSQGVPAGTGRRQNRDSVKHLSCAANHSSSTSPPGSVLFCSQAALRDQNSSVLATQHYLNSLHQDALLSEGIWVAIWTFYGFFYFALPQRENHAMCKNTGKPTGLIRGTIKQGGEMGLVWVSTSETQQQLARYRCHSHFLGSHSPHRSLSTNKYIFQHYSHASKNIRPRSIMLHTRQE